MSTSTTNFGWTVPSDTDLVKDGAAAIRTALGGVDTSFVDLKGGTTGQVLSKASGTDLDFTWVAQDDSNAIQNAIVDAKGDLIAATAADTPARLAVGTNGQVLTADSTAATGIKWADPAGGGKVLQVVYAGYSTAVTSSTSTYIDTGLTATITPSATTSKILVLGTLNGVIKVGTNTSAQIQWLRGATQIARPSDYAGFTGSTAVNDIGSVSINYLDSPATTSATTYKAQFNSFNNSSYVQVQDNNVLSTLVLMEIGA